jgi:hypothetical protein
MYFLLKWIKSSFIEVRFLFDEDKKFYTCSEAHLGDLIKRNLKKYCHEL